MEVLQNNSSEIFIVQEEPENSRPPCSDHEQEIISKIIQNQELELEYESYKVCCSRLREEVTIMEDAISGLKEELKAKYDIIEEISLKFQQEVRRRETLEEHNLELQKLVQELEVLQGISDFRVRELEENSVVMERKLISALKEKDQYESRIIESSSKIEALHVKSSSLEMALQAANETEKDLVDMLTRVSEEKQIVEDSFNVSRRKLIEAENLIETLKLEFHSSMGDNPIHEKKYAKETSLVANDSSSIDINKKSEEEAVKHGDKGNEDVRLMENSMHQDHVNEEKDVLTIKEVLVDKVSNSSSLPHKNEYLKERPNVNQEMVDNLYQDCVISREACEEELERPKDDNMRNWNPRNLQSQMDCYIEELEEENLKLIVYLTTCETQLNDLQGILDKFISQGNDVSMDKYLRQFHAFEGHKLDHQSSSTMGDNNAHHYEGENRHLQEAQTLPDENPNYVKNNKWDREVHGSQSKGHVKLEAKYTPQSQKDSRISEVAIEDDATEMRFKLILGVIIFSFILAMILGKR